jgi:hypothetical protein
VNQPTPDRVRTYSGLSWHCFGCGYAENSFQCPSETTSTVPSVTLMAVWSSIAYAGPAISTAYLSAAASVLSGM